LGRPRRTRCKRCGKEVPWLSKRGLCMDCGPAVLAEVVEQLRERRGPYYERWKRSLEKSMLRALKEMP